MIITFKELETKVMYNNYTAFVYTDGTQAMYSGGEITEDSMEDFRQADSINICNMAELPEVKDMIQANLLAELEPADGVQDDGYNQMVADFANNKGEIAWCSTASGYVYMLVF